MSSLQHNTLRHYGELLARAPLGGWPGNLIVTTTASTGIPAAACIAGAALLALDPDTAAVRATYRDAGFDFLVNTLDEAIRILKNEIRQRRPIAVALTANLQAATAEAGARGLQADLAINAPSIGAHHHFILTEEPTPELHQFLTERTWSEQQLPQGFFPQFNQDDPRQQWLRQLPRYQRSATREPRILWLSSEKQTHPANP